MLTSCFNIGDDSMEYITIKEASEKWSLSIRRIQTLCNENKIDGAVRFGRAWAIPCESERPKDNRIKSGKYIITDHKVF